MEKILQIMVGNGAYGGAEQFAVSYLQHMDTSKIGFDFLFLHQNTLNNVKAEVINNSKIYELGTWRIKGNRVSNYVKTVYGIRRLIINEAYEIVHVNSGIIKVQIIS